jgi:hypothetical protein
MIVDRSDQKQIKPGNFAQGKRLRHGATPSLPVFQHVNSAPRRDATCHTGVYDRPMVLEEGYRWFRLRN